MAKSRTKTSIIFIPDSKLTEENINKLNEFFREEPSADEFAGEGLPARTDDFILEQEFQINFDVRLSYDADGKVELVIARKGAPTHTKDVFKGLNEKQARMAFIDFRERLFSVVIPRAIYQHAYACYWKQDDNRANRKKSYKNIMTSLEMSFERLFDLIHFKKVNEIEDGGLKITTSVPTSTQGGRNKGAKNKAPSITIEQIKNTILKFKYSATFPTQPIIARRLNTTNRTIQRHLRKAGIKLKYNDFAHSILNQE